MVTLNFTLIVELILFLTFLWGTNVLILRPMLRTLDEREELVRKNESQTQSDSAEAETIETRHQREVAALRRETEERFRDARRSALDQRAKRVEQERAQAETEIAQVRQAAEEKRRIESVDAETLAPQLADVIAEQLGVGGRGA